MFQLLKTPVAITVSLLVSQYAFAKDDKDKALQEALLNNAASYLELPTEQVSTSNNLPLSTIESVEKKTPIIAQEELTAINTPSSTNEKSIYPLGLSKEQYIARLKMIESKRDSTAHLNILDVKAHHDSVDKLIARLRAEKEKQSSNEPKRLAPKRQIDKENIRAIIKKADEPHSPSYFERWFGENKAKATNSLTQEN